MAKSYLQSESIVTSDSLMSQGDEASTDNTMIVVIFLCVLFTVLAIIAAVAVGVTVFIVKRRRKRWRCLRVNYASQSELSHRSDVTAFSRCSDVIAHNLCSDLIAVNHNGDVGAHSNSSTPSHARELSARNASTPVTLVTTKNGTSSSLKKSSTLEKLYSSLECINMAKLPELPVAHMPIQFQLGSDGVDNFADSKGGYLDAAEELAKCSRDYSDLDCTPEASPQMKHRRTCSRSMPSLSAHAEALNFMLATPPSHRVAAISSSRPKSFTEKFNHLVSGKSYNPASGGSNRANALNGIRIRPRSFNDKLNLAVNKTDTDIMSYNNSRYRSSSGKSSTGSTIITPISGARDLQVYSGHAASGRFTRTRRLANSINSNSCTLSDSKKQQNGTSFANFRQGVSTKLSSIRASFSKDGRRQLAAAAAAAETNNQGNAETIPVVICDVTCDYDGNQMRAVSSVDTLSQSLNADVAEKPDPRQNGNGTVRLACPTEYVRSLSDFELPSDLSTMDSLKSELNGVYIAAMEREKCLRDSDNCRASMHGNISSSGDVYLDRLHRESNGFMNNCDALSWERVCRGAQPSSQSCSELDRVNSNSQSENEDSKPLDMDVKLSLNKKSCSSGRM